MMAKVVSFECPDNLVREMESVACTVGLSRSQFIRDSIIANIKHYTTIHSNGDSEQQILISLLKKLIHEFQSK